MKNKKRQQKRCREERLLPDFWESWFAQGSDRLLLLKHYAEIVLYTIRPRDLPRLRMRFWWVQRNVLGGVPGEGQCHVCYQVRPRVWHHVIQLHHGGPNTKMNLVPICGRCHQEIHPWLEPEQRLPDEAYKPFWS